MSEIQQDAKQLKKENEESIEMKNSEKPTEESNSKKYQLLLTATNLIIKIKQVNSGIMTLNTWLIVLTKIQLVKYLKI